MFFRPRWEVPVGLIFATLISQEIHSGRGRTGRGRDLALAARPAAALASHDKSQLLDKFQGVYNFLTTPFLSNYELDGDGVRKNVAYHAKARTKRMVIMVGGGLGELYHMDSDTQGALAEAAVAGSQGRCPWW